jgi:hypothetical protein
LTYLQSLNRGSFHVAENRLLNPLRYMDNNIINLPIRSKIEITKCVVQILIALHFGDFCNLNTNINNLKKLALSWEDKIQQDVLIFTELVQFQAVYDYNHLIIKEICDSADKLFEDLGYCLKVS